MDLWCFTNDWEQRKLGEITIINPKSKIPEKFNYVDLESVNGTNITNYVMLTNENAPSRAQRLADKNDIFYQTVRPYQKNNVLFNNEHIEPFVFSSGYTQIRSNNIMPKFLFNIIQRDKFVIKVLKKCTGTSYPSISPRDLKEINIEFPNKSLEQIKVGELLNKLDKTITLHEEKLSQLKSFKKAMLQRMFADKSEFPDVRFNGFTDAWRQRKLGEVAIYNNGSGHEKNQSENGKYELINLNSISIDGGLKKSGKFVDEEVDTLLKGDLVMVLSDVGHGNLLGRVAIIPENNRFVLNQRVALLRNNSSVYTKYLFFYINAHQIYFKKQGVGSSQLNISRGSVENFKVLLPHKDEQIKIGHVFEMFDNLITLQQRKLDHLHQTKKFLLQNMFI